MSNFLGLPFEPWVKNQIDKRQEILGKSTNIPNKDLQFYSTKAPFLRLASSVDVTKNTPDGTELKESVYKKLSKYYPNEDIFKDSNLARNCILQAGVVNVDSDGNLVGGLKKGLNTGNANTLLEGAYGWGGLTERGFVPMPGLINADVQYYGNGALYKAVVNIKCFSKAQFQLIDVLYLRPGYTCLLEFGWSQYLDTEGGSGELTNFTEFLTAPLSKLLQGKSDQFTLHGLINDTKKKYSGNYDAVYGKVSNFNWSFNQDGSYDCQLTLTGMGDLIESLKVNLTNPKTEKSLSVGQTGGGSAGAAVGEVVNEDLPLVANRNATVINEELFRIYQSNISGGSILPTAELQDYTLDNFRSEAGDPPSTKTFKDAILTVAGTTIDQGVNPINPQCFIKYGAFLAFIQSRLLLYDSKSDTPVVVFDMNFDDIDADENVILRVPGQLSADPRVCLVPYSNTVSPGVSLSKTLINTTLSKTKYFYSEYLGRLSNIFVNINFIAQVLESAPKGEDGSLSLLELLKQINKSIINSLGGINSFEVKLSDNGSKIRFIEEIPQRFAGDRPSTSEYTRFNIYGVKPGVGGSFVRDVKLTGETSGELSSLIVIGSQANSNQISANATAFGNYSAGLIDRVIPEKKSFAPDPKDEEKDKDVPATIKSNWESNIAPKEGTNLFLSVYQLGKWIDENIGPLKNHNHTHAKLILGAATVELNGEAPQLPGSFFLPFTFQITIDGLSGMKLYEKFLISDNVLPPSYDEDSVDLQIRGLNHNISSDAWTTSIDAFSVPSEKGLGAPKRPAELLSEQVYQESGTGGGGTGSKPLSLNPPPESDDPLSVTRYNAMQKSYNGVFGRDGSVSGMCAQWSYNLAVNYVEFLRGRSLSNPKLRAGGNANQNEEFFNNLTKLGYTKTISTGLTRATLANQIKTITWGYGDVCVYYANDGDTAASHRKYGHAQIYVGSINDVGWSTSTANNYGTSFVYGSRPSNNWDLLVFRAPEE